MSFDLSTTRRERSRRGATHGPIMSELGETVGINKKTRAFEARKNVFAKGCHELGLAAAQCGAVYSGKASKMNVV